MKLFKSRLTTTLALSTIIGIQALSAQGLAAQQQAYLLVPTNGRAPMALLPGGNASGTLPSLPVSTNTSDNDPSAANSFNSKEFKNGVFETVTADEILVYEPVGVLGNDKDEDTAKAYADAQQFAMRTLNDWVASAYTADTSKKLSTDQVARLQDFDKKFKNGDVTSDNLSATIMNEKPTSANEILSYLADVNNSVASMQQQMTLFDTAQQNLANLATNEFHLKKAVLTKLMHLLPSAAMATVTFKPSQSVLDWFNSIPRVGPAMAWLAQGSVSFSLAARPWNVTVLDRRSKDAQGNLKVKGTHTHYQLSFKMWANTDAMGKLATTDVAGGVRAGLGFILGDIQDLKALGGIFSGASFDGVMPGIASTLGNVNIKFGGILSPSATSLNDATNGYFMVSKNFGIVGNGHGIHGNVGALVPIEQIANYFANGAKQLNFQTIIAGAPGGLITPDNNNNCNNNSNNGTTNNNSNNNNNNNGNCNNNNRSSNNNDN